MLTVREAARIGIDACIDKIGRVLLCWRERLALCVRPSRHPCFGQRVEVSLLCQLQCQPGGWDDDVYRLCFAGLTAKAMKKYSRLDPKDRVLALVAHPQGYKGPVQ